MLHGDEAKDEAGEKAPKARDVGQLVKDVLVALYRLRRAENAGAQAAEDGPDL